MPTLNVSRVLNDSRFLSSLVCARGANQVDDNGLLVIDPGQAVTASFSGVVTPANDRQLKRLPDGSRIEGAIAIITEFALREGDVVTYNGTQYTVANTQDYSAWGSGFGSAIATVLSLTGSGAVGA